MMDDDLKDLIENPRENEGIELKSWVDLDDAYQRAQLARHLAALANHGGGYLIFGFKDDLSHEESRPASLEKYNRDTITAIIKRYLTPAFQCEVVRVADSNGYEFPVIRVPGHGTAPIAAKASGPHDAKGRPRGIAEGTYYIRKPGPESAPIIGAAEWNPLVRQCLLNDRDQLLSDMADLVQTPRTPAPPGRQRLEKWHNESEARFLKLLPKPDKLLWPVPIVENRYQLSYLISAEGNEHFPMDSLVRTWEEVNNEVRDTVWTGWSMFYPFSRPSIAPAVFPERADGTGGNLLETNLMGEGDFEITLPDFWRLTADGRATLVRAYREDRERIGSASGRAPGTWLSPETVVRETMELVAHANSLARRMEAAPRVSFRCTWIGLKGRELDDFSPLVYWRSGRIASADRRITEGEWGVAQLRAARTTIVAELSCRILELFDFRDCNAAFVERLAERFVKL